MNYYSDARMERAEGMPRIVLEVGRALPIRSFAATGDARQVLTSACEAMIHHIECMRFRSRVR